MQLTERGAIAPQCEDMGITGFGGSRHHRGALEMWRISRITGLTILPVVPGEPLERRRSRPPVAFREGLPRRATCAAGARADARAATGMLVPVAIDSETGERCCVSARQAGLLQTGDERRGA